MSYSTIDAGVSGFTGEYACGATDTNINLDNPANASGVLNSFKIKINVNNSTVKVGTFYGSGTSYTMRDYETWASITSGSEQTLTGVNCDVSTSDLVGLYSGTAGVQDSASGGSGVLYVDGDNFHAGAHTYTTTGTGWRMVLYGSGVTVPDAPTNVSATDNLKDKVTITWTAGTGETGGHRVYRAGTDISGVVAHGTNTYNDTTGEAGTTYSYTVKAINDAGLSAASTADNGTRLRLSRPPIFIF